LFWQQTLPPKADGQQVEIRTYGQQNVPKSGSFTVPLFDRDHPLGYISRPGCWAKEIGKHQHAFTFENDREEITVTAPPHALIQWECHGFMYKNAFETCVAQAAKDKSQEEMKRCGPPPSELH
jgi:hypothetical protein